MLIKMFKSKIHRATITECDLNYEGSCKIDLDLMEAANIRSFESIFIWNLNNGERLMTYAIPGERGSKVIGLNGSAARMGQKGDLVIISTFADMEDWEAKIHKPTVVLVGEGNQIKRVENTSGGLE